MSEEIVKEILVEGVDARELYGAQDAYLEQMRELCPKLKIVARGDKIKALGARSDVAAFERRMNALVEYYIKYGHISSEVVSQAFSSSIEELSAEPPAVDKDAIVYGNNGNIIRARTVNQQKLVKLAERNDLLFAVGPAGSGKTYQLALKYVCDVVRHPEKFRNILAVTFTNKAANELKTRVMSILGTHDEKKIPSIFLYSMLQ